MELGLSGKSALVAASSRGLGAAVARQLAREGACVAVNGRDPERVRATAANIRDETGARILEVAGDVSSAADVERIVAATGEAFGGVDILVTNAGGPPPGRFDELDDAAWTGAVDLMLMSAVRLIRTALPALRRSPAASVLSITSITVKQPLPNLVLSNSIRMAVIGLTKTLALELGGEGIRFNSILPAFTETERVQELMADRARRNGTSIEEESRRQAATSALGRMGTPEEFANVAAFLVSPAAAYLTGHMLNFDGGMYKGMF